MGTHNKTARLGFVTASPLYQSNVLWIFESSSQAHIKVVSWMLLSWIPFPATSGYLYVYVIQFDSFQSVTVQFQSDSQCIWFFSCFQCKCTALQYTCCCRHIPFCLMNTFSLKKKKNQMMNFCWSIQNCLKINNDALVQNGKLHLHILFLLCFFVCNNDPNAVSLIRSQYIILQVSMCSKDQPKLHVRCKWGLYRK